MSQMSVLASVAGNEQLRQFADSPKVTPEQVFDVITSRGVNACPPLLVGVGVSTSAETAARLSKKAILRPVDSRHANDNAALMDICGVQVPVITLFPDTPALALRAEWALRKHALHP